MFSEFEHGAKKGQKLGFFRLRNPIRVLKYFQLTEFPLTYSSWPTALCGRAGEGSYWEPAMNVTDSALLKPTLDLCACQSLSIVAVLTRFTLDI